MKSNSRMIATLVGFSIAAIYFIATIFLFNKLEILHIFPVFAGEDDFSIRRLSSFSVLILGFVLIGWLLSKKLKYGVKMCWLSLSGMIFSSIIFGVLIALFKSNLIAICDRDTANIGVLLYYIAFVFLNLLGFFLGSLVKSKEAEKGNI